MSRMKKHAPIVYRVYDYLKEHHLGAENGILSRYSDNTFKPKGYITRAEVTALIIRASKINTNK